jgi:hypothetical protein
MLPKYKNELAQILVKRVIATRRPCVMGGRGGRFLITVKTDVSPHRLGVTSVVVEVKDTRGHQNPSFASCNVETPRDALKLLMSKTFKGDLERAISAHDGLRFTQNHNL